MNRSSAGSEEIEAGRINGFSIEFGYRGERKNGTLIEGEVGQGGFRFAKVCVVRVSFAAGTFYREERRNQKGWEVRKQSPRDLGEEGSSSEGFVGTGPLSPVRRILVRQVFNSSTPASPQNS